MHILWWLTGLALCGSAGTVTYVSVRGLRAISHLIDDIKTTMNGSKIEPGADGVGIVLTCHGRTYLTIPQGSVGHIVGHSALQDGLERSAKMAMTAPALDPGGKLLNSFGASATPAADAA